MVLDIEGYEMQSTEFIFNKYQQLLIMVEDFREQGFYYFEDDLLVLSLMDVDGNNFNLYFSYESLEGEEINATIEEVTMTFGTQIYYCRHQMREAIKL